MPFKFEKLQVWQESLELSELINQVAIKFPREELYILTVQIKRASDSIALNIAEGSTGQTTPEFKKFLGYAVRSGIEVIACIYLARKRRIISDDDFDKVYEQMNSLIKRIQALRNSLT